MNDKNYRGRAAAGTFSRQRRMLITSNRSPSKMICFTGFLPPSLARFIGQRHFVTRTWCNQRYQCELRSIMSSAPKGRHKPAQGNALGGKTDQHQEALKGRNNPC